MMLIDELFFFFGNYEVETDVSLDIDGRGALERIQRSIGNDIDVNIQPFIDNISANIKDPFTCFEDYVILLLESGGMRDLSKIYQGGSLRHLLINMSIYNKNKGTKRCLDSLLRLYNSTITSIVVTEHLNRFGFDSTVTFDDSIRRFDIGACNGCSEYSVDIISPNLCPTLFGTHFLIIEEYWKPADIKIRYLTWNSVQVDYVSSTWIDADLNYLTDSAGSFLSSN